MTAHNASIIGRHNRDILGRIKAVGVTNFLINYMDASLIFYIHFSIDMCSESPHAYIMHMRLKCDSVPYRLFGVCV